jgi:alpha-ketoglutarate-dependent taurine dioxygenase
MTLRHPLFAFDRERPVARLARFQVVNGQKLAGEPLDEDDAKALEAFEAILEEPGMSKDFHLEPGQIQIVDNLRRGHRRTASRDWPEEERKRRLVRLWLRDRGRPFYHG